MDTNPFTFGALALDEAFTNRERELGELATDMRNGQDVVIFAPRRYGKSSLALRAAQDTIRHRDVVLCSVAVPGRPDPVRVVAAQGGDGLVTEADKRDFRRALAKRHPPFFEALSPSTPACLASFP